MFRVTAGQGASLLPVFCWELVLSDGSFGENGKEFLVFELGALLILLLRQRVASLGSSLASLEGVVPFGRVRSFATSCKFGGFSSGTAVEVHAS